MISDLSKSYAKEHKLMELKRLFKYFVFRGAVYYTMLSAFIMIVNSLLSSGTSQKVIVTSQFWYILLFSYIMALGAALRKISSISKAIGWLLHAICYIGGFFLFVMLCAVPFAVSCVLTAVFAVFYAVFAFVIAKSERVSAQRNANEKSTIHKGKKNKVSKKNQETYKSMFS